MKISLFIPCYVDQFFPEIGISMIEVLERLGHQVDYPEGQTCCGQPAFNSGFTKEAKSVAATFMDHFADSDVVVVPSGSCCAMVKVFCPELFKDSPQFTQVVEVADKTWEFSDFLVTKLQVLDVKAEFPARVTFHDGCHGLRELRIKEQPRELLRNVSGLELVEMDEAESCCGFGGTFSVKFPEISSAMTEIKTGSISQTNAEFVVSNDPSCLMQIQGYIARQKLNVKTIHLAEVLARI